MTADIIERLHDVVEPFVHDFISQNAISDSTNYNNETEDEQSLPSTMSSAKPSLDEWCACGEFCKVKISPASATHRCPECGRNIHAICGYRLRETCVEENYHTSVCVQCYNQYETTYRSRVDNPGEYKQGTISTRHCQSTAQCQQDELECLKVRYSITHKSTSDDNNGASGTKCAPTTKETATKQLHKPSIDSEKNLPKQTPRTIKDNKKKASKPKLQQSSKPNKKNTSVRKPPTLKCSDSVPTQTRKVSSRHAPSDGKKEKAHSDGRKGKSNSIDEYLYKKIARIRHHRTDPQPELLIKFVNDPHERWLCVNYARCIDEKKVYNYLTRANPGDAFKRTI